MISMIRKTVFIGVIACSSLAFALAPDPNPGRFAKDIELFGIWDGKNSFPEDAILFVGSSSIRMWPTASAFSGKPIINRGFGGSEISDVIHYYDQVVGRYKPSRIFLYAGDNDIGGGKGADQVFRDFKLFAGRVRAELPETRLFFISIKPSVLRWNHWPTMTATNKLVRNYVADHRNMAYVDLATPLLDETGNPKDVYMDDGLHLNEYGYQLWQQALAPYLE